jgi:uracil-DNA glycosylase family 4
MASSRVIVPNQFPRVDPGAVRLAVVGEAPALEECSWCVCAQGHGFSREHWVNRLVVQRAACPKCGSGSFMPQPTPFVGESGRLLDHLLEQAGLERARCFVGNCSQHPLRDDEKDMSHCHGGLRELEHDLSVFKPSCVLLLGGLALNAFLSGGGKITDWRGSIFTGHGGLKCVAAMHPAAILRAPAQLALLRFDVNRAVKEAQVSGMDPIRRCIETPTNKNTLCARLWEIREMGAPVGYDIEGTVKTGVTVCALATAPDRALSIPFKRMNWSSVWSKDDEADIMDCLGGLLEDQSVPKIMHNAFYEMFVHRWLHGIKIAGAQDAMLGWHVLYPELLKDLSVVASVLTRQPYWGAPGAWATDIDRDTYNAIDACVTLEAWHNLRFSTEQKGYYEHSRDLLEPCLEMGFEGMRYDAVARDTLIASIQREVFALQGELDELAGIKPPSFGEVVETVAFARHRDKCQTWADIVQHAKPSYNKRHSPVSIDNGKSCAILE